MAFEEVNSTLLTSQLLMNDSDERFFEQFKLGTTRYYTLLHLEQSPGLTLSELSQRLICTKGNMTRILKSMQADGLLERYNDPRDGRAIRHTLTPRGMALLVRVRAAYRNFLDQRYAGLELYEIDSLQRILSRFNRRLEASLRPTE
ncbi:transcriptional regulator [Longilinea arvoryzae]|uniref:Transcriptional regulator n=1 Tax=Longilinea arvoryzae TaxID=360412 RepID=A0A0S7BMC2_9CHLR|nr:MarR family transcriptional regulator [Longilinea arvoryzae]GAP15670.1 transcriptional regulator [Longilinea arvoryzae]